MRRYLLAACGIFFSTFCSISAQTELYVSPEGNDMNSGTIEFPFKTIKKAQTEARNADGDVVIYIRQGNYRLTEPLIFSPADGNEQKSLTLRPYHHERVIINGGAIIDNMEWKPYKDGIITAHVDPMGIDMLLLDNEIKHMARFPNYDPNAVRFNGTSADATSDKRIKSWKNPAGGFLHAMHDSDWGDFHYRITGKDKNGRLMLEGGHQNNRKSGLHPDNRMVENIFEELDFPGEWFYDSHESVLYYYPSTDEDIQNGTFETPILKHLVEFRGDIDNPVRNVTIEGIEFCNTSRTFMEQYEPLLRSDWTIYRGGAIILDGTENCTLENLSLYNLGGNAVFFSNYNRNSKIKGSHIHDIGASAICFVGDSNSVKSPSFEYGEFIPYEDMDTSPGSKTENYPLHCEASDNLIHNIGKFEKQVTGIELSMSKNILVSHNSIYDTPRAGINISEGTWGGHVIEFNDVFDTVKETGDHGSFNSWGRDRFWHPDYNTMQDIVTNDPTLIMADAAEPTIIRNNRFRCDRGWDIDLDDGSTNYIITCNLCLNGGIKLREGFYRTVENNIIINNTFHPHVWFDNSGDVFSRNIVMTPYQPINISRWGNCVDYNIFTNKAALEKAKSNQTDRNSIYTIPVFRNASEGDYSISEECTGIFRIGFKNFAMDEFGVRPDNLKKLARTPLLPVPIINDEQCDSEITQWHGWNVKNLETLGERSATGMNTERGVYIISSSAFHNPLRDFIQSNDVILGFDDKQVNNIEDLQKAEHEISKKENISLTIFRSQKEITILIPRSLLSD